MGSSGVSRSRATVAALAAAAGAIAVISLTTRAPTMTQPSDTPTPAQGARFEQKVDAIVRQAETGAPDGSLTPLLEREINAFLMFQGASRLPAGITDPVVRIGAADTVSVEAVVDLDAIKRERDGGWLDPLQYLSGRIPVVASAVVRSANGAARIVVQSVTVGGVPVPVQVLHELVRHYTRTPESPDGTRLDAPLPLPYRITELRLSPGRAVIVQ